MISDLFVRLLIESSLRGTVVLALAALVAWSARRGSAELRHAVWKAGVLAVLIIPLGLFLMPRWPLPILPARESQAATAPRAARALSSEPIHGWIEPVAAPAPRFPWSSAIALLWLSGCVVLVAREIRCRRRLARLVRGTKPALDVEIVRAFRDASLLVGMTSPVECRLATGLRIPIACGVERPMVLLPEQARGWDPSILRDVLVHELSHLRRRDPLWLWIGCMARAIYWFHPAVWLATSRMLAEGERACDDAVIREGERPSRYAETLLFVAGAPAREESHVALAFVRRHGLERRITEVLSQGRNLKTLGRRGRTVVGALAALVAVAIAIAQPVAGRAGAQPEAQSTAQEEPTPVATPAPEASSWRAGGAPRTVSASVCNENQGPMHLVGATVQLTRGLDGDETRVARPRLTLANQDAHRAVVAVKLAFDLPSTRDRMWKDVDIEPGGSTEVSLPLREWSAVVPTSDAKHLVIQVTGVHFTTGDDWEGKEAVSFPSSHEKSSRSEKAMEAPTPRPSSRDGRTIEISSSFPDEPSIAARFRNPPDAPLVIVGGRTPLRGERAGDDRPMTFLPAVMLENRSDREIVAVRLRYKADAESHAVSGYDVTIAPHRSLVLRRRDFDVWGRASEMTIQVLGVRFADGSLWGTMDSRINGRDRWVYPLETDSER